MDRTEYLQFCKDRAIECLNTSGTEAAMNSFLSDMQKHPDLENHRALSLMMDLRVAGNLTNTIDVNRFILECN